MPKGTQSFWKNLSLEIKWHLDLLLKVVAHKTIIKVFVLSGIIVGAGCWVGKAFRGVCMCCVEGNYTVFLHPHQCCLVWHLRLCCSTCQAQFSTGSSNADLGTICMIFHIFIWCMNWGLYEYWMDFLIMQFFNSVELNPGSQCFSFRMDDTYPQMYVWANEVLKCTHTVLACLVLLVLFWSNFGMLCDSS